MLAIVNCKTCELSAKYSITADDSRTLSFDAAQFHALCKHADPLRALDCPHLTSSIKDSLWGVSAGICTPDHLAISAGELRRAALAKRLGGLLGAFPTGARGSADAHVSNPKLAPTIVVGTRDAPDAIIINSSRNPTRRGSTIPYNGRAHRWGLIVAAGLAVFIAAGMGFQFIGGTHRLATATEARPQESIVKARPETNRSTSNAQAFDPQSLPALEGTIRRMDGISKSCLGGTMSPYGT